MPKQRIPLVIPAIDSTEIPTISESSHQGSSSTEGHTLHGAETLRQERATKRIDFVSQLPFELVSSLILPDVLSLPYYRAYLQVCKTWRQRVLQSSKLHYKSFSKLTQSDMHLMLAYAPYLHQIKFGSPTPLPVNFFASAQFTRLQSLSLVLCSKKDMHALYPLLKPIGQTLKEIQLSLTQNIVISLKDILQHFPKVEAFTCNSVNVTDFIVHPQHTYKVKKLVLSAITQPLGSEDVIALLKRFPSLEHLVLTDCQDSGPLATLHQYCPALGFLTYIMTGQTGPLVSDFPAINIIGFHTLIIGAGDNFNIQHVISLLTAHCDKLVNVNIHGKMNQQSTMTSAVLGEDVVFKQLRKLSFEPDESNDGSALVQWILKRVSNARKIDVINCNIDDQHVYKAMKQAKKLESLTFTLPSTSLIHLLEYHGTLGQHSKLNSMGIDVNFCHEHGAHALKAVAHLSNLRRLYLQLYGATLGEEFVAFIENMARECPYLEVLNMESLVEFPPAIIAKFPLYPNLQELTLGSPNVWDECLLQLLKCPSLKGIFID